MPAPRRRFVTMLWLSLALHALVIGFAQLPPSVKVPLPSEFNIEIAEPASVAQAAPPQSEQKQAVQPESAQQRPAPPMRHEPPPPHAAELPVSPSISTGGQPVPAEPPSAIAAREAPGPVLNVPLLADARYYLARELDVQPSALSRPEPVYPTRAEEQDVAGRVLVRLHLEADGSISRTEVVSVIPGGVYGDMFRKATLDSLKAIRFKPALRNGLPVRAVVEIPVVFEPDN